MHYPHFRIQGNNFQRNLVSTLSGGTRDTKSSVCVRDSAFVLSIQAKYSANDKVSLLPLF